MGWIIAGAVGVGTTILYGFAVLVGVRDGNVTAGRFPPGLEFTTRVFVGAGVVVDVDAVVGAMIAPRVRAAVGDGSATTTSGESFTKVDAARKVKPVNSQHTHTNKIARIPI
jgi:hypothetical protein